MTAIVKIDSPSGGVMAGRVGAMSGRLKLRAHEEGDKLEIEVAYDETDEWWPVKGSPLAGAPSLEEIGAHLAADPGVDEYENPIASDLKALK